MIYNPIEKAKNMTTKTIKEQLNDLKKEAIKETAIQLIQKNSHMTVLQLMDLVGDDETLSNALESTPLCDLAGPLGPSPVARPKIVVNPAGPKKKPATRTKPKMTLAEFLDTVDHGEEFKTAAYTKAAGLQTQTALNHLAKSKAVTKRGNKRNMTWVAK